MSTQPKDTFSSFEFSEDEQSISEEFAKAFSVIEDLIEENLIENRYVSLAKTQLEIASMWINKSISRSGLL